MNATCFYLPKRTGTHADALAAAGLAHLLAEIGGGSRTVTIRDGGPNYEIRSNVAITDAVIQRWTGEPFYPYIRLKGDKDAPAGAFDYEEESKRLLDARKAKKAPKQKRKSPALDTEEGVLREASLTPHPEIAFLRIFNGMRKGFKGDILLNAAFRKMPPREPVLRRLASLAHKPEQDPDPVGESCPVSVKLSASQWFMPVAGKGVSRVKADGANAGQFREELLDWFETWLRFIGMYRSMTSHGIGDDLKLVVIDPADLDQDLLLAARCDLQRRNVFGGKIDVRAPIELARSLVEHSEERLGVVSGRRMLRFAGARTSQIVRGLHVTMYKKMGTASSVMNVAFLGVPSWAPLHNRADADAFLSDLDELDKFQQHLKDDISEDIETLREMRDFVSSGSLPAALGFFARVAFCVMQRLEERKRDPRKYAVIFRTDTVRRILMGISNSTSGTLNIEPVISNEGFQRIAKAIRAATIHAQLHSDAVLQPRYGLAQAWRQQAPYAERFTQMLAEFVQRFNADVVRQREIDKKNQRAGRIYPSLVTDEDLSAILRLIADHGSSVVAHLLLAFGYSQVSKAEADSTSPSAT